MQKTEITLKNFVNTGATDVLSNLIKVNDYLVYPSFINEELVDENNVKNFLNDIKNVDLSNDFLNFLQNNSTKEELDDILYNDKKLSNALNDYYNTVTLNNLNPGRNLILKQVFNSKEVQYKENNFNINNKRINTVKKKLIDINTDDSLYIQVVLKTNQSPISPISNYEFTQDIRENGILYKQGFVDLNMDDDAFAYRLKTNEDITPEDFEQEEQEPADLDLTSDEDTDDSSDGGDLCP